MPAKRKSHEPTELAPGQCRDEIVAIIAVGLARMIRRDQVGDPTSCPAAGREKLSESAKTGLELSGETRLSVSAG
ncbi:MAG: hypothetical protein KBG29_01240 [Pseudomonadales bacterium]|nr:hypothetical protein [Pseudomonadales bacterium]